MPQTFTNKAIPEEARVAGALVASHRVRTVGVCRADPNRQTLINVCKAKKKNEGRESSSDH